VLAHFSYVAGTTKQRLLTEAAKFIGVEELANRLGVPSWLLVAWIEGAATMPDRKLKALAEVLDEFGRPEKG
jgi:hypothetical protein